MGFAVSGLSAEPYLHLYGLSDEALGEQGVKRYVADETPGFPDRIEMRDAKLGETLLLLNHVSPPENTPYRASHAIFILEGARDTYVGVNEVPPVMLTRLLSLRAFDAAGMMVDADLAKGHEIAAAIERFFENSQIAYIHAHNALRGCYSGRIDRG
ncbi:MAG: DUF1203 domain-containing protein [Rhizobiaceae bacterium]|nr:DUF1203 domain-containing protein [Rhizobiaceae bacterium]